MLANPPGGGLVPGRWGSTMYQGDGVGTQSLSWTTHIRAHGQQFEIRFASYYQVPIDVTVGWAASLVNTRSPFIQLGRLEQCA